MVKLVSFSGPLIIVIKFGFAVTFCKLVVVLHVNYASDSFECVPDAALKDRGIFFNPWGSRHILGIPFCVLIVYTSFGSYSNSIQ